MTTTSTALVKGSSADDFAVRRRMVVLESEAAPAEIGGTYAKIESAAISDSGEVAFSANLADSTVSNAILLKSGDTTRVLFRCGDETPAGGRYKKFGELDYSVFLGLPDTGEGKGTFYLIFRAELEGGPAPEGIFLWSHSGVRALVLAGARSPRGRIYKSFLQPSVIAVFAIISNVPVSKPLIAYVAQTEDGGKSIVIDRSREGEEPVEILSTGDKIGRNGNEEVVDFVISRVGGVALSAVVDLRKNRKRFKEAVIIAADATSQAGIKEKARFDGMGKITRILAPPTLRYQLGFFVLEFKSGASAILARDSFFQLGIIARTGDPAPGLPGETIQSFGLPEANNNFPFNSQFDFQYTVVLSPVRLSGGRLALWKYLYHPGRAGEEPREEKRLLLVEGESIGDGQGPALRSFAPVKVNNTGSALVRGRFGEGVTACEGLFIIDGILDR